MRQTCVKYCQYDLKAVCSEPIENVTANFNTAKVNEAPIKGKYEQELVLSDIVVERTRWHSSVYAQPNVVSPLVWPGQAVNEWNFKLDRSQQSLKAFVELYNSHILISKH